MWRQTIVHQHVALQRHLPDPHAYRKERTTERQADATQDGTGQSTDSESQHPENVEAKLPRCRVVMAKELRNTLRNLSNHVDRSKISL